MNFKKYIEELKRRNVFKVAITYGITAWLLLQVVETVVPIINAPYWILKLVLILLIIGFPIAIIFAWAFEMSPSGIIRTESAKAKKNPFSSKKKKPFTSKFLIVILVLVVIGQFAYNKFLGTSSSDTLNLEISNSKLEKSIAVLPLFNVNNDEKLEYFSNGVTSEIIDELAKVHQFRLSPFSSTRNYKNTDKSAKDIATELDVSLILSGNSRIYGDSVRLSFELVNPVTEKRIWGQRYDDVLSNTIQIQNDIAKQIVAQLNIELSPVEKSNLDKINTNSPEAFDLYLRAKEEYSELTKEVMSNGIKMLKRAIELDPNYAQAYTLLAWIYYLQGSAEVMGDADFAVNSVKKILPLIEKSISLDSAISDNYLILGAVNLFYLNNLPKAIENIELALDMNSWPKIPTNYCMCTAVSLYTALGKLEKATELIKLSKKEDLSNKFVYSDEGTVLLNKGDNKQAIYAFKQAAEFNDIPFFNFNIGWAYYFESDYESALFYLNKAYEGEGEEPLGSLLAYLSNSHFKMGNIKESDYYRKLLTKRKSLGKPNLNIPLAIVSVGRGNKEEALRFLEKAYKEKEYGFAWFLNIDPIFNDLKSDSTFIKLNEKVGFED
jgi:adenylate cyclase